MEEQEWDDRTIARAITIGVVIGVPFMFVVGVLIGVIADIAFWKAAAVAGLPAFFIGPYIGGLMTMGATGLRLEHETAPVVTATPTDEEHPVAA